MSIKEHDSPIGWALRDRFLLTDFAGHQLLYDPTLFSSGPLTPSPVLPLTLTDPEARNPSEKALLLEDSLELPDLTCDEGVMQALASP